MARYGRIMQSVWEDPDFLALKASEQHLYFALITNPGLSRCGVATYIPSRFEHLASDLSAAKVAKAVTGLRVQRFLVVDDHTQELLVRSYVRYDGVLDRLNMGKAAGTAFQAIVSPTIRAAVGAELRRIMRDEPGLAGWAGLAAKSPTAHAMACGIESSVA